MDVVYLIREAERNEELRYSLRSIAAYLPHDRVWIAGYRPSWVRNVGHIPVRQAGTKYQHSTANLRAACEHGEISQEFVLMNDDFFIMRHLTTVPVLHRGPVRAVENHYRGKGHRNYILGMVRTRALLERLGHADPLCYELHVPMPVKKQPMLEALEAGRGVHILHKRTLYGTLHGIGGTYARDVKIARNSQKWEKSSVFLSTSDSAFRATRVGQHIRRAFPRKSQYER